MQPSFSAAPVRSSPLPPRAQRAVGRGRGWGVAPLVPMLVLSTLKHPPTPPRHPPSPRGFGGRGEGRNRCSLRGRTCCFPICDSAALPGRVSELICPTGCFLIPLSSPFQKNISLFQKPKSVVMFAPSRPHKRGGSRSSRTLRRDAVDAAVSLDERTGADGEGVWSWRPDAGAKLCGMIHKATGAKEPGPRGERDISRKPSCRECRLIGAYLWLLTCVLFVAHAAAGALRTRHSLRPLFSSRVVSHNNSGGFASRECDAVFGAHARRSLAVIARLDRATQYSRDAGDRIERPRRTGSPGQAGR